MRRANSPKKRSKGAGTPRRETNPRTGGRPARGTAGTNPRTGQAAVFFLHCRHLRVLPGLQWLRVRGRARPWYLCWGQHWVGLSSSYHPLFCHRPLTPFAGGSSEEGPSTTSLCSLTQQREIHILPLTLYFIPAVDPSSRAPLHVASGHRVDPRWSIARRGMCGNNPARARGDFQRVLTSQSPTRYHGLLVTLWVNIQRRLNFFLCAVTERDTSSSDVPVREISKISRLRGRSAPLWMCRRSVASVKKSQG